MSSRPRKRFATDNPMRDRDLVRTYWPVELRLAFDALFDIDAALGEVVASSTQPGLGAIRLAWWSEALERLDHAPPPSEPRLRAAAEELLPRGITGADLAGLVPGWGTLLDEWPDGGLVSERGSRLFGLASRLLGASAAGLSNAGALYACVDVGRRGIRDLRSAAEELGGRRFPPQARPLSALAVLASRDLFRRGPDWEQEATPARAWALLKHRLTGRVPAG